MFLSRFSRESRNERFVVVLLKNIKLARNNSLEHSKYVYFARVNDEEEKVFYSISTLPDEIRTTRRTDFWHWLWLKGHVSLSG